MRDDITYLLTKGDPIIFTKSGTYYTGTYSGVVTTDLGNVYHEVQAHNTVNAVLVHGRNIHVWANA